MTSPDALLTGRAGVVRSVHCAHVAECNTHTALAQERSPGYTEKLKWTSCCSSFRLMPSRLNQNKEAVNCRRSEALLRYC